MSQQPADVLERLLGANDLGWMIDLFAPPEGSLSFLLEQLHEVAARYRARVGISVSFTPESLASESAKNPHKVRAFLQALGATRSPDMLVMVWRILQGLSIREVEMTYREQEAFSLRVVLARPEDGEDSLETYQSRDIGDATLLQHFGVTTIGGRPLFDGFFPLRLKGARK